MLPKVDIVVIDSRSNTINREWVEQCFSSIRSQIYEDIEMVVLDNTEHKYTIGKCRNMGVDLTREDAKWVLFVDDDDFISQDYVLSLLLAAEQIDNESVAMITSSSIFMYPDRTVELRTESPIGMWKREILIKERFDDGLLKKEDVELLDRLRNKGYKSHSVTHIAGYFYRQHNTMNSGMKLKKNQLTLSEEIRTLANEIKDNLDGKNRM